MNNIVLDKTYIAELPVQASSTAQQVFFPVLQNLDRKLTTGIQTYNATFFGKSQAGNTLAPQNLIACSYLNLVVGDVNQIWNMPLQDFQVQYYNGQPSVPFLFEFNNLPIIWAKSYVYISDTSQIPGSSCVFMFNIHYTDVPVPVTNK